MEEAVFTYTLLALSKYVEIHVTFPVKDIEKERHNIEHLKKQGLDVYPFQLDTSDKVYKLIINIFQKKPFKIMKYYSKEYEGNIMEWIGRIKPSIIQIHTPHMANYGFKIKEKYPSMPIIYRAHDISNRPDKILY